MSKSDICIFSRFMPLFFVVEEDEVFEIAFDVSTYETSKVKTFYQPKNIDMLSELI